MVNQQFIFIHMRKKKMNNTYIDYEFHQIQEREIQAAINVEQTCFPPHEACSVENMQDRISKASELFYVAINKTNNQVVAILNGIATNEQVFQDEFFTNASLHQKDGENIMLTGLAVLDDYRNKGIAKALMHYYVNEMKKQHKKRLLLTCLEDKVAMYQMFGFMDNGIANSTWGNETWHEMIMEL